jgi:hypothetical protein
LYLGRPAETGGRADACTGAALQLRCGEYEDPAVLLRQTGDAGCPVPDVENWKAVRAMPVFSATRDYTVLPLSNRFGDGTGFLNGALTSARSGTVPAAENHSTHFKDQYGSRIKHVVVWSTCNYANDTFEFFRFIGTLCRRAGRWRKPATAPAI